MHKVLQEIRSRIQHKIILPFLILTLIVVLAGSAIVFLLLAISSQESFDKQLAEVARVANYSVLDQERANLQFLIELVFAPRNEQLGTPSVYEGIRDREKERLREALKPYFVQGMNRPMLQVDRLIAFDRQGYSLVDLERQSPDSTQEFFENSALDFSKSWFVPAILNADEDLQGDKYAGLLHLPSAQGATRYYFATIAPVKAYAGNRSESDEEVVGGIIVAMYVDQLIERIADNAGADILAIYDHQGHALVSTFAPEEGLPQLDISQEVLTRIPTTTVELQSLEPGDGSLIQPAPITIADTDTSEAVFNTRVLNSEEYQLTFMPLVIRQDTMGIIAAGLSRAALKEMWQKTRLPMLGIVLFLTVGIFSTGIIIARQITAPLDELVATARAVTAGDFDRRSRVTSHDEIGLLSSAFNHMTDHLVSLVSEVLAESSKRAAIVESIADGIVVCDVEGAVEVMNLATYKLLGLQHAALRPGRFEDMPLGEVSEKLFGSEAKDFYTIGNHYVRVAMSPVMTVEGEFLGNVYVLQDMTAEVNMDRAKTGFIATISHEMKTPLTSMRGNLDMLSHGMAGPLNDEQRPMIDTIGLQTTSMTRLVNNMILVAGLDSGSTAVELEPTNLKQVIDKSVWPIRKGLKKKNLSLKIDVPPDLRQVSADPIHLRTILQQLVDNARVYTEKGGVTILAVDEQNHVRVDVHDTGCGIDPDMQERVFERFVRGKDDESNDRPDRGIGLGLSIVKQLVGMHGGHVWVSSTPGEGSTFSFTLRYSHGQDPERQSISEAA